MVTSLRFVILTIALWAGQIIAAPECHGPGNHGPQRPCKHKLKRKAWHTFTRKEKKAYIDADLCLMGLPATLGFPGAKNRFEELQWTHQVQASIIHSVGAFLPFHRLLMHAHEKILREECGYKGAQPYWDEARDAGNFVGSVVLDPVTGFGGTGVGEDNCVEDGPFAGYVNGLGPGYKVGDNCLYRDVNDTLSAMAAREYIDWCYKKDNFVDFWRCAELAPHNGGHAGVGGKMLDPIASPGDPIFYLHHTWLDKVFWEWQALDLPARLKDIGGENLPQRSGPPTGNFPPDGSGLPMPLPNLDAFPPLDAWTPLPGSPAQIPEGDPGSETTLTHILNMWGVIANATIADVMDIGGPLLCYEYV
ncbi:uncharacterized protein DNG_07311 [Cephalotrichum gorgonifer]|uniref:Tyrosinase copper-binding domain-containing protein n=1 Tax=Cephalotrichum gorgonifer TaxID=2041049 RepID=A0AAE8N1C3_9PEZI|nr:uncharacterized protein DNG_07311 [Cephalotrichum gorgonifer]